jgi:hypothetical protein
VAALVRYVIPVRNPSIVRNRSNDNPVKSTAVCNAITCVIGQSDAWIDDDGDMEDTFQAPFESEASENNSQYLDFAANAVGSCAC